MDENENVNPFTPSQIAIEKRTVEKSGKLYWARGIVCITCAIPSLLMLPFALWLLVVSLLPSPNHGDVFGGLLSVFALMGVVGVAGVWSFVLLGKLPQGLSFFQVFTIGSGVVAIVSVVLGPFFFANADMNKLWTTPFLIVPLGGIYAVYVLWRY